MLCFPPPLINGTELQNVQRREEEALRAESWVKYFFTLLTEYATVVFFKRIFTFFFLFFISINGFAERASITQVF